jgi:hypothetical protein
LLIDGKVGKGKEQLAEENKTVPAGLASRLQVVCLKS